MICSIASHYFNFLAPIVHLKVTAGLFKYLWPFSGHQGLKGLHIQSSLAQPVFTSSKLTIETL